jgi:hypothetical protein
LRTLKERIKELVKLDRGHGNNWAEVITQFNPALSWPRKMKDI